MIHFGERCLQSKRSMTWGFPTPAERAFLAEVGGVDHQRVAFPVADGIAQQGADVRGRVLPSILMTQRTSCTISMGARKRCASLFSKRQCELRSRFPGDG